MKDFLGNELKLGDAVVFVELGYRNFLRGQITKMTAKTVWITHVSPGSGMMRETKQTPEQTIRINT